MDNNFYYTASLTNVSEKERDFLKSKSCMLTLSIGQSPHEGDKFRATLNMINAYFKKCTIAVNDTLQRHTLAFANLEKDDYELYSLSHQLGTEWLERNLSIITEELHIPYEIIRWDHWFKTARFRKDLEKVEKLYADEAQYKLVVHQVIDEFVVRYRNRIPSLCLKKGFNNSLAYLLEECACMLQWFETECDYEVYPSIRNDAISSTFALLEPHKNSFLLLPAGIKLIKRTGQKQHLDLDTLAMDSIFKTSPGHIYWKNKHGVFCGCNTSQAKSFGFKKPKLILGKSDFDILDYDMALAIRKNDLQVMRSGKTHITEEKTIVNGQKAIYISHKSPIKDSDSNVVGVLGVSIDITKQKKFEHQLIEKTAEHIKVLDIKKAFLGKVSHEIRTPLHGILGIATELSTEWEKYETKDIKKYVDMIASSSKRLMSYTKNILDLAVYHSGKYHLIFEKDIDLVEIAKATINDTKTLIVAENKNLDIVLEVDLTKTVAIECDQTRISEVFYNILNNAVKYSDQGNIVVKIEKGTEEVTILIADLGVGIAKNERILVFEEFTQSSKTQHLSQGTGLGLAICKEIVTLHNGRIWVEDNQPRGSIFKISLPYVQTHKLETFQKSEPGKKLQVLIIDDEESCLWSLSMMLTNSGHEPMMVQDGTKALEYLEKYYQDVDLILLDMTMSGMNGLEILRKLKINRHFKNIPVIIQTGAPDSDDTKEALLLGAVTIISKPYTKDIIANIANFLCG